MIPCRTLTDKRISVHGTEERHAKNTKHGHAWSMRTDTFDVSNTEGFSNAVRSPSFTVLPVFGSTAKIFVERSACVELAALIHRTVLETPSTSTMPFLTLTALSMSAFENAAAGMLQTSSNSHGSKFRHECVVSSCSGEEKLTPMQETACHQSFLGRTLLPVKQKFVTATYQHINESAFLADLHRQPLLDKHGSAAGPGLA